jgi:GDP-mannose 6-dehydrogenase
LSIFDRSVHASKLLGKNREFIDQEIPHFESLLAGDLRTALDGAETIVIGHANRADIEYLAAHHAGRPIVDLQGIKELRDLAGASYQSIC